MSAASSSSKAVATAPHTWLDDVQGFLLGAVFVSLGIALFGSNGQVTGGTAGIAFLLHYLTGWSIGLMFFVANLPFFWLALKRMGWPFAIKSLIAVALLSTLIHVMPHLVAFGAVAPLYSAIAGGLLIGMGGLAFVRHGASIGGVNILAVYLQKHHGISAGKVQIAFDVSILIASLFVVEPLQLMYSVLGAVMVGAVLWINHKPGRYMGV
ncbi:YitT family protein [Sinimarinibacterium sp. CAU 1509]|uniref:YitT family protein n=1 Tax=Sinimarinibacterium sp. CAU 1509 TaxID=2562283 RepID=UPI0010AD7037|nr:YitT family protein [Sinimarinibacterium sp. CAU 1509]TJY59018.1 YitT family protein [Sinimarinibacterium sp. CAU 1509]